MRRRVRLGSIARLYDMRRVNHSIEYVTEDGANVTKPKAGLAAYVARSTASITASAASTYSNTPTKWLGARQPSPA